MELSFEKFEGLGNDFLLVEEQEISPKMAVALCDRHRGVGADGLLQLFERDGDHALLILNADGSRPEMCGNGLRCAALSLVRRGREAMGRPFVVQTDAGPHRCVVHDAARVEVEMRAPSFDAVWVGLKSGERMVDAAVEVDGQTLHLTALSMGNPHAVTFDAGLDRRRLGPRLENDPAFTHGANIGFAALRGGVLHLDVWERGAGWTEACGTGACAAVAAAVATGRLEAPVTQPVQLPGGRLDVRVTSLEGRLVMLGPARRVFGGRIALSG